MFRLSFFPFHHITHTTPETARRMVLSKQRVALVVGGAGALGRAFVNALNDAGVASLSLDLQANPLAQASIILHPEGRRANWRSNLLAARGEVQGALQGRRLAAVLCAAGAWTGGSVGDDTVAEVVQQMQRANLRTAVDAAHIAYHTLAERGLLVLTGAAAAVGPTPGMIGYGLAKAATHQLVRSVAEDPGFPAHATVLGVLPETLDTPGNREGMPDADHSTWTSPKQVAEKCVQWALDPSKRPDTGTLHKVYTRGTKTVWEEVSP